LQINFHADTFGNYQLNKKKLDFHFQYIEYIYYPLVGLFTLAVLLQLAYYLKIYGAFLGFKRAPQLKKYPISVIICARNEAENLTNNLPSILNQKHENFEVIVINDCSTDETEEVLGGFLKKYKNLKITNVTPDKKFTHGKKLALTLGIKAATNEWLVFTDADCYAESEHWLERMQENYTDDTEIILGYGGYKIYPGLLNKYIRYDTVMIALQYFGFTLAGVPYMGVGRNLSYRKSLFFKNKGFAKHYELLSGDDDLFVNETAGRDNTAIEFHPESHTRSEPKHKWKQWFDQKKRHFTTAERYKPKHFFLLGIEPLSRFLFYLTSIFLLCLNIYSTYVLILLGIRFLTLIILAKLAIRRLKEPQGWVYIVIFDVISLFINFIIYLSTRFRSKKVRWK
jgi:biofilm PGA synthesis N-glycosyltransferase PgaC